MLEKYKGVKIVASGSYPRGTVEIGDALNKIAAATPDAVFCLAHAHPVYTFIRNALNRKLLDTLFFGGSNLNLVQKKLKKAIDVDVVATSVVPNPEQMRDLPIVKEYKRVMKKFLTYRADSPFYSEAFINLSLFDECLKRLKGTITLDKIVSSFESFKDMNYKGLKLNFDKKERTLSSAIWINPGVDRSWIEYKNGVFDA